MRRSGPAFGVYHAHERRRSLRNMWIALFEIGVGGDKVVFPEEDLNGNVWVMEPVAGSTASRR